MTKLPYVRTMFATGMLFQVIYVACVLLWFIDPQSERALVAATGDRGNPAVQAARDQAIDEASNCQQRQNASGDTEWLDWPPDEGAP